MIYLLGASHLMALLDACSSAGVDAQLHKLDGAREPAFLEWDLRTGLLPQRLKAASLYRRHTVPWWGETLAEMISPTQLGIAPGYSALLQSIGSEPDGAEDILFLAPRGEEHHLMAAFGLADPCDFRLPWRPDLPLAPGCAVIPLEIAEEQMAHRLTRSLLAMRAARMVRRSLRIVCITCPPPAATEALQAWHEAQGLPPHPILLLPTVVRLKHWLLYARAIEQGARALRMEVLAPPPEALAVDGTLKIEFVRDVVHGNRAYGELVCQQMAALVPVPALEGVA